MSNPTVRPMRARMISSTSYPLETLWLVWMQSRMDKDNWPSPEDINWALSVHTCLYMTEGRERINTVLRLQKVMNQLGYNSLGCEFVMLNAICGTFQNSFDDTIEMLLGENVPVAEHISFTFLLENIPITLREQLVRHRIGTHLDPRVGCDIVPAFQHLAAFPQGSLMQMQIVPELAQSSFWSQTARVVPWDNFYTDGRFIIPESLEGKRVEDGLVEYSCDERGNLVPGETHSIHGVNLDYNEEDQTFDAKGYYLDTLKILEHRYKKLTDAGVPLEDARNLIPLGATHSITWTLNLKAMMHVFGKRSCWVAQSNIWESVMSDMAEQLCKLSPSFRMITQPICFKKGKFTGCQVPGTIRERIQGTDGDMPPCPLYIKHHTAEAVAASQMGKPAWQLNALQSPDQPGASLISNWVSDSERSREMLQKDGRRFSKLWQFQVLN